MKIEQISAIKEVETCKDILWYLKGQVDLAKKEDLYDCPFDKEHIQALESIIHFVTKVSKYE